MTVLGIDEAGRGPVIGPMVICGFLIREDRLDLLKKLNDKDSKALSRDRREELVEPLREMAEDVILKIIPPKRIDRENLNSIELKVTADIIGETLPSALYLDVPTNPSGIANYRRLLLYMLETKHLEIRDIHLENGADEKYPVVGAASILAKTRRDSIIGALQKRYGDFGSGYPADRRTITFLERYGAGGSLPPIVRRKWKVKPLCDRIPAIDLFSSFDEGE
jgi:ribonuclease HII